MHHRSTAADISHKFAYKMPQYDTRMLQRHLSTFWQTKIFVIKRLVSSPLGSAILWKPKAYFNTFPLRKNFSRLFVLQF